MTLLLFAALHDVFALRRKLDQARTERDDARRALAGLIAAMNNDREGADE